MWKYVTLQYLWFVLWVGSQYFCRVIGILLRALESIMLDLKPPTIMKYTNWREYLRRSLLHGLLLNHLVIQHIWLQSVSLVCTYYGCSGWEVCLAWSIFLDIASKGNCWIQRNVEGTHYFDNVVYAWAMKQIANKKQLCTTTKGDDTRVEANEKNQGISWPCYIDACVVVGINQSNMLSHTLEKRMYSSPFWMGMPLGEGIEHAVSWTTCG